MPRLSWITDENLSTALNEFRESAGNAVTEARTRQVRNVIDPFRSLLIASALDVSTASELVAVQDMDSSQRGLSNALGTFHEKVLGRVVGWENHDAGYDLENASSRLLAEVKNKHNTMNASNSCKLKRNSTLRSGKRELAGRAILSSSFPADLTVTKSG